MSTLQVKETLEQHGLRVSHQRILILQYLITNYTHPTVDRIFEDLRPIAPTLSKTTIYSTLKSFAEVGLVRVITIENNETRYDATTNSHGHFKCDHCGEVYDFEIDLPNIIEGSLKGFTIRKEDFYLNGVCPKCQK